MGLLDFLRGLFAAGTTSLPAVSFRFPYSPDPLLRREELWHNLQHGILLEDKGVLLAWDTPFLMLRKYAERYYPQTRRSKALWQLGRHPVLDGYILDVGIYRERLQYTDQPFRRASVLLGFGESGLYALRDLLVHLTDRFGQPDNGQLSELGDLSVGEVSWRKGDTEIRVSAVGQYTVECYLYIGKVEA